MKSNTRWTCNTCHCSTGDISQQIAKLSLAELGKAEAPFLLNSLKNECGTREEEDNIPMFAAIMDCLKVHRRLSQIVAFRKAASISAQPVLHPQLATVE